MVLALSILRQIRQIYAVERLLEVTELKKKDAS